MIVGPLQSQTGRTSKVATLPPADATAEDKPFSRTQLNELLDLAEHGAKQIFAIQRNILENC